MSVTREVTVWCDYTVDNGNYCGAWATGTDGARQLRRELSLCNWATGLPGGKDYCPEHRESVTSTPRTATPAS